MVATPRGIRNNNPLNIRKGNNWQGERPTQTDPSFEEFQSLEMGIRAAFIIIRNYMKRRINTPRKIIETWAPRSENNTAAYISSACKMACLNPDERILFTEKNKVCRLVWAMAYVECGQVISFGRVENAYALV